MSDLDPSGFFYVVTNLTIFVGYLFLAAFVVPRSTVRMARTRLGGILFFATCGLTHLEQAIHYVWAANALYGMLATEWHMLMVHAVQAVSVWLFVSGLYLEAAKWGPWHAGHADATEGPHSGDE